MHRPGIAVYVRSPAMLSAMALKPDAPAFGNDPPPTPPVEPDAGDCCGEGCVPCIFDIYEAALQRYRDELVQWRLRHPEVSGDPPVPGAGNR